MSFSVTGSHMIVLPGGGYAEHAPHEAEPAARWLGDIGVQASVFRYPLNARHPEPLRSTSLDSLVTPQSPPFFVWHTAEDPYVSPEHTYRFASALAASQVPHAVHVFGHGPHSLGLAQDASEAAIWTTLATAWIQNKRHPRDDSASRGGRQGALAADQPAVYLADYEDGGDRPDRGRRHVRRGGPGSRPRDLAGQRDHQPVQDPRRAQLHHTPGLYACSSAICLRAAATSSSLVFA